MYVDLSNLQLGCNPSSLSLARLDEAPEFSVISYAGRIAQSGSRRKRGFSTRKHFGLQRASANKPLHAFCTRGLQTREIEQLYFPMQKVEKMRLSTSSEVVSPVSASNWRRAW